ncbi:MAG: hypothetical protein LQ339_003799 [Xanthoria mediterranea]|nr:MAG: hypothetical protein LQ339_003799 [Xanthoria mediterranea]
MAPSKALAAATYLSDARARAQAHQNIVFCVSLVDTVLCQKIEKQLSGEMPRNPEQQQIVVEWKQFHLRTLRLSGLYPAVLPGAGPWMHSIDKALRWYFKIFDVMVFEGRLSRIVELNWSGSIEEPECRYPDPRTGRIPIKMRKQGNNNGVYSGYGAVAVMKDLLGQMCWAYLVADRCTCRGCTQKMGKPMMDQAKWIRLYGLVLRLAGRDLGLLFENGFPVALEKLGPRAGQY